MSEDADNWAHGLTERQRRFCEAYSSNGGNALDAARKAGYKKPHPQGVENMQKPTIKAALDKLRAQTTNAAIATREERQAFWSQVLRDAEIDMKDRLKASELLGKAQTDFINKTEVTGANGGPVVSEVRIRFVG
ncbi:MAG: terminase small subunit [Gammaproteobacteria bacterium]|nr:terminase small subunit [Gammaproteobacteria bacterium]